MRSSLVVLQAAMFVALALLLAYDGEPRLAGAQALLAAITLLVYV